MHLTRQQVVYLVFTQYPDVMSIYFFLTRRKCIILAIKLVYYFCLSILSPEVIGHWDSGRFFPETETSSDRKMPLKPKKIVLYCYTITKPFHGTELGATFSQMP